jgi:alcohol dehydrogenase
MKKTFSFTGAKKIVFGCASFESLADQVKELGGRRPLVVLDKNLSKSGFRERALAVLAKGSLKAVVFDKVEPEPRLELADEGTETARRGKCDIVVGIGGGSAMDVAKAIAALLPNKAGRRIFSGSTKSPGRGFPPSWFRPRRVPGAR